MTQKELISKLNEWGLDTTKHKYELKAQEYDRCASSPTYTVKFTAPGDWVAFLSMTLHHDMSSEDVLDFIEDYWGSMEEIPEKIRSLKGIEDYATCYWWGDGDDYIISIKNLDTGEYLYQGNEDDYEEYEDDDWDEDEDDEYID